MKTKTLGLHLGTSVIAWAIVQEEYDERELLDSGVLKFKDGVEYNEKGEVPMTLKRTQERGHRRNIYRKKIRKIELLKVLIANDMCPFISQEDLRAWKAGEGYPMNQDFLEWQKTDVAAEKNPYHDRHICLTQKLDLSKREDRYIVGRALYHIAHRRGFLSNRNEGTQESDGAVITGIRTLTAQMQAAGQKYLGEYLYQQLKAGKKVRGCYTDRNEHYVIEFNAICEMQGIEGELKDSLHRLLFSNRFRPETGEKGKCTLEKSKIRCAVSHPRFEEFRMWQTINNIRVKVAGEDAYRPLTSDEVAKIIPLFHRKKKSFTFEDIAKKIAGKNNYCSRKDKEEKMYRFNYDMFHSVAGCPVTAELKSVFGNDYLEAIKNTYKLGEGKTEDIIITDIWHVLKSYTDESRLIKWAMVNLSLDEEKARDFASIKTPQGYASLSLRVINRILVHLRKGIRYDEAVLLANLPSMMSDRNDDSALEEVQNDIRAIVAEHANDVLKNGGSIYKDVCDYLRDCGRIRSNRVDKLYHHSINDIYQKAIPEKGLYQLGSPRIAGMKNPMVMRTMFMVKKFINKLLRDGVIDENTKINLEMSRELNDKNVRLAISSYQKEQESRNLEAAKKIREYRGASYEPSKEDIEKFVLWEEQNHRCPYTFADIHVEDFLCDNPKFEIDYIIPRSRCGDDSMMNKVLCDASFNRQKKQVKLVSELTNSDEIISNLEPFGWYDEIRKLKFMIEKRKHPSGSKEERDSIIKQRHFYAMKLEYLEGKIFRFKVTETPRWLPNMEKVNTAIVRKYARAYLETVFRKVYVMRSLTTSEFKRMWGIKRLYDELASASYAKHCVDAITLDAVTKHDYDILARFLKDEDDQKYYALEAISAPMPWPSFRQDVKNNVDDLLIPHITPSYQTKGTKKKARRKGKVVMNSNGTVRYMTGDTGRGELHQQTYYGAIKVDGKIRYVVKKELSKLEPKDVDNIVDKAIRDKVAQAVSEKGFKRAMEEPIWSNEELGHRISKVRLHTRLRQALTLKTHRDRSEFDYKSNIYVKNARNYCMGFYEGRDEKKKIRRDFQLVGNLEMARYYNGKLEQEGLLPDKKNGYDLKYILKSGMMVLFYQDSPDELLSCSEGELSDRLYKIIGLAETTTVTRGIEYTYGSISLRHHRESRPMKDLNQSGGAWKKNDVYRPLINFTHNNFNAMVEGVDFRINILGQVEFCK